MKIEQVAVGKKSGSFELLGVLFEKSSGFTFGGHAPGGFAIVGEDFRIPADQEFEIIAVRRFGVEREGASLAIGSAGESALQANGVEFGEFSASSGGFDVMGDGFIGILGQAIGGRAASAEQAEEATVADGDTHGVCN